MASTRPFSYDGAKCVMQYLEANMRFHLTRRAPSLTAINTLVPLTIDTLSITPDALQLNNTKYSINIIEVPRSQLSSNENETFKKDVDKYGIELAETEEDTQRKMRWWSTDRAHWMKAMNYDFAEVQIKKIDFQVQRYTLRRENREPPFEHFLQLRVINTRSGQLIMSERLIYNKKIVDAEDYLLRKIVEGKTVHVDMFKVNSEDRPASSLLPLVSGQLQVQNIEVLSSLLKMADCLQVILRNRPLKCLKISWDHFDGLYSLFFVTSAGLLNIPGDTDLIDLQNLSNKRVHIESCINRYEKVPELVGQWKRRGLEMGSYFSIGFKDAWPVNVFLDHLGYVNDAKQKGFEKIRNTKFPKGVIIPLNNHSELVAHGEEVSDEDGKFCEQPFIAKLQVHPRGTFSSF